MNTVPLGKIAKIFNGNSISVAEKEKHYRRVSGTPYIGTAEVGFDNVIDYHSGVAIPDELVSSFRIAQPSTPLVCAEGGSAGRKIGITDRSVCFGNKLFAIEVGTAWDGRFLFYFCQSEAFQQQFRSLMTGMIGGVSIKKFKEIQIPVFLLPEQQRIIGILDQAFEAIAKAKGNAERNLASAKELFESERESLFLEDAETEERCFNEICDITSTLVDPREAAYQPMLHIGAGNIESDSGALSNVQSAAEEKLISGKFIFDESMVLYSKIRPYLKKVVAPEFRGLCSADIYPLTPNKNLIQRGYLYHMLLTKQFTDYAILGSERAGMPKVNRNHLFAYKVGVPAMSRQTEVVGRLQEVRAASENLCANYKARIRAIDELKSSILQQAFSGNL